jgi:hypothetical protein
MKIFDKSVELARALMTKDWNGRRCFHLSFVYRKNQLLVVAENSTKTSSRNRFNSKWDLSKKGQCSELRAFISIKNKFNDFEWKKSTMINVRLGRNGELLNSRPCVSCSNLIKYMEVGSLWYSTDTGNFQNYYLTK